MKKVVVIGTGGHAKVVIDILSEMENVQVVGVTSKDLPEGSQFCNYPVLGNDEVLPGLSNNKFFDELAIGVGGYRDNTLRAAIFEKLKSQHFKLMNVIHPAAYLSKTVRLGEGCVIFPGVTLNTEVSIGNNSIIITGATIDHETQIGNNVLVATGVTIGANVVIRDNAFIALGAKIISGVSIGSGSLIGAGSVVVKSIGSNCVALGIPAKVIKTNVSTS